MWNIIRIQKDCFLCEYLLNVIYFCDQSWIFSIITPVFSVTWSSEIILICWFAAQETFLNIINDKTNIFVENRWIESSKEQHLFVIKIFCDVSSAVSCVTCWIVSVWSLRAWWRGQDSSLIDLTFIATRYVLMKGKCTHLNDLYNNTSVCLMLALLYNSFIPQKQSLFQQRRHMLKVQEIN